MIPAAVLRSVNTELRTTRLLLRCPREGDGTAVHQAVKDSLQELRTWPASLPWAMEEPSIDSSETYCRESAAAFIRRSALVYLVFDTEGTLIASTSLHNINWMVPKFEVGFWCRSPFTGMGYTKEAIGELMRYAFDSLGASRVAALTDEENTKGRSVCESLGMRLEGVLRNECIKPDGTLRNTCLYAALRSVA